MNCCKFVVDKLVNIAKIDRMRFEELLRNRRKALGLSLRLVAQRVGVNPAYLSRVESGYAPPSDQLVLSLSKVLDLSADELFLIAGKLPNSLRSLVEKAPIKAARALRGLAEMTVAEPVSPYGQPLIAFKGGRAIEDGFPFEELSEVAEVESWRKEIYRPIYHIHKWWAQRLGSVFRGVILSAVCSKGSSVMDLFYEPVRTPGIVVFDPFMGSGTIVGEANKLGCTVVGRDINPVAYFAVRTALGPSNRAEICAYFKKLYASVGSKLRQLYRSLDSDGKPCDVLYYFWVKVLSCPACRKPVDLFSSFVFARHAYADRNPAIQVVCADCGAVFPSVYGSQVVTCPGCKSSFNPHAGIAKRTTAVCRHCTHEFAIAKTALAAGHPPFHRMYAKLVLKDDGTKEYLRITTKDLELYEAAKRRLNSLNSRLPSMKIQMGYNTRQIINYGYRYWHELFNERQLLGLVILAEAIKQLPEGASRDALISLFSGTLEFNNMFASYKGEGTGAVRHMFSHHILKPERMPIEANIWGTPKSSGSFSTLFRSRLLRAIEYRDAPFEIAVEQKGKKKSGRKVFGISPPMGGEILDCYPTEGLKAGAIYLSCGSSRETDLPNESVDLVITDPPFFDNVHYSELADFFYSWQMLFLDGETPSEGSTTRHNEEVQDVDPISFSEKLKAVFKECYRVLRDSGLLIFSYHHSREEGWSSVASAVIDAGFSFVQCQPVKSEMSVAAPKNQAKDPIDLDVLLVCRKQHSDSRSLRKGDDALKSSASIATSKVARFNRWGRKLSKNDVRVVLLSQLLVELSAARNSPELQTELKSLLPRVRLVIQSLWSSQKVLKSSGNLSIPKPAQQSLF